MSELSPAEQARNAKFQPRLEAELAELLELSEATTDRRAPVTLDQQSVGRLARMDAMQVQAMAQAVERRRRDRIYRVRSALGRIEEGEFGYCVECGEAIAEGRLDVDPASHLCVRCA
ncbi:TraR/DksA C4-type zinc finger protein [Aurantimonas sp. C2-6-R+9]|uniref:TraR/DksA family transcriptional regulator n=1 Tax=unclassified Aurantimonas TaxID=2638230 RepID=UPI002E1794DE|nr:MULTISPECIES: TraR/DksA C4-type zinc finger protein [unclassified Aurantimonas]MEC5293354.1 TraR/DksA C4-type zinc finger protein [Aurantimonas sp. C2-3-R2]MEC5383923.1 TraR/DksA C4-type zinc finger protein [Aurantimonas sp. C2-6-R+9]MEC5414436.1 TraR/DksA C4-type zinc finger protein [Aurantimonas sp. C2-4-R8]